MTYLHYALCIMSALTLSMAKGQAMEMNGDEHSLSTASTHAPTRYNAAQNPDSLCTTLRPQLPTWVYEEREYIPQEVSLTYAVCPSRFSSTPSDSCGAMFPNGHIAYTTSSRPMDFMTPPMFGLPGMPTLVYTPEVFKTHLELPEIPQTNQAHASSDVSQQVVPPPVAKPVPSKKAASQQGLPSSSLIKRMHPDPATRENATPPPKYKAIQPAVMTPNQPEEWDYSAAPLQPLPSKQPQNYFSYFAQGSFKEYNPKQPTKQKGNIAISNTETVLMPNVESVEIHTTQIQRLVRYTPQTPQTQKK